VGIFAEDIREGEQGALVPVESPQALAQALADAIAHQRQPGPPPSSGTWTGIGQQTRQLYEQLILERAAPQGVRE
jgi:glycosyltransferase involved in cell wall biosynthesis